MTQKAHRSNWCLGEDEDEELVPQSDSKFVSGLDKPTWRVKVSEGCTLCSN